jgi:hypothetical protein
MYEIIIKQTKTTEEVTGKNWVKVGQISKENEYAGPKEPKTYLSDEYGYSPEITKSVTRETEIYRQKREGIDLEQVIKAVNGIEG